MYPKSVTERRDDWRHRARRARPHLLRSSTVESVARQNDVRKLTGEVRVRVIQRRVPVLGGHSQRTIKPRGKLAEIRVELDSSPAAGSMAPDTAIDTRTLPNSERSNLCLHCAHPRIESISKI